MTIVSLLLLVKYLKKLCLHINSSPTHNSYEKTTIRGGSNIFFLVMGNLTFLNKLKLFSYISSKLFNFLL